MIKKIFFFFFALSIISCSTNDDVLEEQNNVQQEDLQPEKAFVYYAEFPKTVPLNPLWYYTFTYENGKLTKMAGKIQMVSLNSYMFFSTSFLTLSYDNNLVKIKNSDNPYTTVVYTMENNKPKKSEYFEYYLDAGDVLIETKTYTYEADKIIVYQDQFNKSIESYTTYFFDSNKNLIKSEKLEKSGGVNLRMTTTNYSNFDHAKNPFKKLNLVNETFFEKSLSTNNYRKIEGTTYEFYNPNQYPPGKFISQWNYNYDSQGQVVLYHPLQ